MGDVVAGLLTGLSLIVAIGAQNAFVLRQGLRRSHVGLVVAICALSDLVLIVAGVAGIGVLVDRAPWAIELIRWLGVAFLTGYGVGLAAAGPERPQVLVAGRRLPSRPGAASSVGRSRSPGSTRTSTSTPCSCSARSPPRTATPGGGGSRSAPAIASIGWFAGLGYGARLAAPRLASPRAWQVLDVLVGLVMLAIAVRLALG